jgi:hypothetical protein
MLLEYLQAFQFALQRRFQRVSGICTSLKILTSSSGGEIPMIRGDACRGLPSTACTSWINTLM